MPERPAIARLRREGVLAAGAGVRAEPLAGGWWNEVLRVRGDGIDWVVKTYADGGASTLFPILPADEARALDLLAGREVAPASVAFLPRTAAAPATLVYAFHPGGRWDGGVEPVARLLRRSHGLAPDGLRRVPTDAAGIVAQGDALLVDAAAADAAALRARRPAGGPGPATRLALLHTDAGPGNLIDGPAGLRLIDWQCPALGDPAEDCFSFLSPAFQLLFEREPLAPEAHAAFLAAYDDPPVAARLAALWPALTYRMAAYCALRRAALRDVDPDGSARYADALARSLEELA